MRESRNMRATWVNWRWMAAGSRVNSDVVFTSRLLARACDFFATIGSNNCGGTMAEAGAGFVSVVAVFSGSDFGVAGGASAVVEAALFVARAAPGGSLGPGSTPIVPPGLPAGAAAVVRVASQPRQRPKASLAAPAGPT